MTKNDMLIIYQQGIYDENNNISVKEYTDKVLNKAYMLSLIHI